MAVDMFLKLDGVKGESQDSKHKGEIDIESFSWGASNAGSAAHGGGGGAGKVSMQDFHFVTRTSAASPELFLRCASGQHIREGVLTVRKAGEQQLEFLKVTMSDVLVSSWQQSGDAGGDVPMDQVSFNFSKVQISYLTQGPTGGVGDATTAGWDVKANTKF
jgi:type VI secretion system secreted protein Hcp